MQHEEFVNGRRVYSRWDAAQILGIGMRTMASYLADGRIESHSLPNNRVLVFADSLAEFKTARDRVRGRVA